jgi:hypothetical protein
MASAPDEPPMSIALDVPELDGGRRLRAVGDRATTRRRIR